MFGWGWFTAIDAEGATPEVAATIAEAVEGVTGANCQASHVLAPYDLDALRAIMGTLTAAAAARIVAKFPDRWREDTTDTVRATAERGFALSAPAYVDALDALAAWRCDLTAAWGDYDALYSSPPPRHWPGALRRKRAGPDHGDQGMFGAWVNAAGLRGISVPGRPHPDGRPIGVQIVALFGHDAIVLEIAQRLEALTPWADRWPALALTV